MNVASRMLIALPWKLSFASNVAYRQQQRVLFFSLVGRSNSEIFFRIVISLNCCHAWVQLCRIQLRVPEYGWTTQKIFHLDELYCEWIEGCSLPFLQECFLLNPSYFILCCVGVHGIWWKVGFVTGICCTCFLLRCFVITFSAFDKNADLDVLDHPILNLMYYMLVEILPSALVLFILRKLPPKRVSDQYHPLR
ncbi:hypothetical protein CRYUN_Cryun18bG0079600 [Craigia yunnanensis]